ncbi:MAG: FliA/WhiG family RNA polymerase sigma factor [Pseudonocardia sp.]
MRDTELGEQSARPSTMIDLRSPWAPDRGGEAARPDRPDLRVADDGSSALWQEYSRRRDRRQRDRVVLHYTPLVRRVAGKIGAKLPAHLEFADLVQCGVFGLIDAVERYEPERGARFETFAVQRIRGAIIDELRAQDWVPRTVRDRARALERAKQHLESQLSRRATDAELAAELDITSAELRTVLGQIHLIGVDALDELVLAGRSAVTVAEVVADDTAPDPVAVLEEDERRRELAAAVSRLAERDRRIVLLYYFEELTLAEIGLQLGVTESRVCQLHARVVTRLRGQLLQTA